MVKVHGIESLLAVPVAALGRGGGGRCCNLQSHNIKGSNADVPSHADALIYIV